MFLRESHLSLDPGGEGRVIAVLDTRSWVPVLSEAGQPQFFRNASAQFCTTMISDSVIVGSPTWTMRKPGPLES